MEYFGNIRRIVLKSAKLAGRHLLKYYHSAINKIFSLKSNISILKMGIILEYFGNIRRKNLETPTLIAQHLFEGYLGTSNSFPGLKPNYIFKIMLQERNDISKLMSADHIEELIRQNENLVELALAVIGDENQAAMGPRYNKETIRDVLKYFRENAPLELEKLEKKFQGNEKPEGNTEKEAMPGQRIGKNLETPTLIAQHLLESYLNTSNSFPGLKPNYIFKIMLQERNDISKLMSADHIEELIRQNENLVELALAVIGDENQAAMGPRYIKETIRDVLGYFRENAPLELEKLEKKFQGKEKPDGSPEKAGMPDHRTLEKRIASLIAGLTSEMFNNPNACIVMYKDYDFACFIIQEKDKVLFEENVLAKMNLREVEPQFEILSLSKTRGDTPKSLTVRIFSETYAGQCLNMLLKRI
jgi:hypothetical protein